MRNKPLLINERSPTEIAAPYKKKQSCIRSDLKSEITSMYHYRGGKLNDWWKLERDSWKNCERSAISAPYNDYLLQTSRMYGR